MSEMPHCLYCNTEFEKKCDNHNFCKAACRAAYHREKAATGHAGKVKSIRPLKNGGISLTLHITEPVPPVISIGQLMRLHRHESEQV